MAVLRIILGDQLSRHIATLDGLDAGRDVVLMMEVAEESAYVAHHKQKIALVLSAMRHFAGELRAEGIAVDYVALDDPANTGSFTGELRRALQRHRVERVVVTEPGEWRVLAAMRGWAGLLGCPVEIRDDTRFFAGRARFVRWAAGRRSFRMEYFYREMRRESGLLMQGDAPIGGQWNFDAENRRRLPRDHVVPPRRQFAPDAITAGVLALVERRFAGNFGSLADFNWPVTRDQALQALEDFIAQALPLFGDYQDAMRGGEPFVHHSLLAPSLNIGLLSPREVCARAEAAFHAGQAPLNAVEGFIRQILGWREYVRGLYWLKMPDYAALNALEAQRPLPAFYWSGDTPMACLRHAIDHTRRHAYSHHIQRLMLTGNFALLAGIRPQAVCDWYLAVYADAFEWVELPNTLGMALFADGGLLASKPYAASGAYIDRMSDFCGGCAYDVKLKSGPRACPFNRLYWAFLIRNLRHLAGNPRLAMPYRQVAAMDAARQAAILREAEDFLDGLET